MSSKTTPEERAEAWLTKKGMWPEQMSSRINVGPARQSPTTKELFATCIREEVEPLEKRVAELEEQLTPTAKVFDRLQKCMEENPEATRASFEKSQREHAQQFERYKESLSAEERMEILEGYADETLSRHHFGPPAMEYLERSGWIADMREAHEENVKLRALVQELVDGLSGHANGCAATDDDATIMTPCSCGLYRRQAGAISAAKSQGFTPTNTKDE